MNRATTRRTVLGGIAAAPVLAAPAVAAPAADAVFHQLWLDFVKASQEVARAEAALKPVSDEIEAARAVVREQFTDYDEWRVRDREIDKRFAARKDPLWDALCRAWNAQRDVVLAIYSHPANTMYQVGVKLAAIPSTGTNEDRPDEYYLRDAAVLVMRDIDRLHGTAFAETYADAYSGLLLQEADDGAEAEA